MASAGKRARDDESPEGSHTSATGCRSLLEARCSVDSPDGAWRLAAEAAGETGADAHLCRLGRSILSALTDLSASAEAARIQLRSRQREAGGSQDARWDELAATIESAEAHKRVALERELCAVDSALEKLRAARAAAQEAATTLSDAELVAQFDRMMARLDDADAQLLSLPTMVVEPHHVGLVVYAPADPAAALGAVVAPRPIRAEQLSLRGIPSHALPGELLSVCVVLTEAVPCQSAPEIGMALEAAAAAIHVSVSHVSRGGSSRITGTVSPYEGTQKLS